MSKIIYTKNHNIAKALKIGFKSKDEIKRKKGDNWSQGYF